MTLASTPCSSPTSRSSCSPASSASSVISKVPNTLHTPLMSGTNAIHGIVLLGGLLVVGLAGNGDLQQDPARDRDRVRHDQRRRRLPRHRPHARDVQDPSPSGRRGEIEERERGRRVPLATSFLQDQNFLDVLYIVAFSLFIQGLRGLTGPTTAVRGNRIAAVGMAIARGRDAAERGEGNWGLIALGVVVGTAVGVPAARQVKMTAMPQMVALFNGVGGGAVCADLVGRVPRAPAASTATSTLHRRSSRCSRRSSARSPSGARTSPSASSRKSSPGRPITLGAGAADRQPRAARRSRSPPRVDIAAGDALRSALHRHAGRARRCSATPSCCRSAAPTCRS